MAGCLNKHWGPPWQNAAGGLSQIIVLSSPKDAFFALLATFWSFARRPITKDYCTRGRFSRWEKACKERNWWLCASELRAERTKRANGLPKTGKWLRKKGLADHPGNQFLNRASLIPTQKYMRLNAYKSFRTLLFLPSKFFCKVSTIIIIAIVIIGTSSSSTSIRNYPQFKQ